MAAGQHPSPISTALLGESSYVAGKAELTLSSHLAAPRHRGLDHLDLERLLVFFHHGSLKRKHGSTTGYAVVTIRSDCLPALLLLLDCVRRTFMVP